MEHVTEIIPEMEDMPDWMREAFGSGQFFAKCRKKVEELESEIVALNTSGVTVSIEDAELILEIFDSSALKWWKPERMTLETKLQEAINHHPEQNNGGAG